MKKIAIGFAVLLIILAGAAYYLHLNLDSIVKAAIEKYGSEAAHTAVKVDGVKLSVTTGEGSLNGLSVHNPDGFTPASALSLGIISVKLDTHSLAGNGPIIIREIIVEKPNILFEANMTGDSNLQAIERNTHSGTPAANNSDSKAPARKIIINNLVVRNGQIQITHPLLQGKLLTAVLPTIQLTNLGKENGGATPAVIADLVLRSIVMNARTIATNDLMKNIGAIPGIVKGTPATILNQVNGLLGK